MRNLTFSKSGGQLAIALGISDARNAEIERTVLALIARPGSTLQSVLEGLNTLTPQLTDAEWTATVFAIGGWQERINPNR